MLLRVQEYLKENSLEKLEKQHGVVVTNHNTLPLIILNTKKDYKMTTINNECRGLILELKTWKLISKSFYKLIRVTNPQSIHNIDFRQATILKKEDGTMISCFNYKDEWIISCKHNFCDDKVAYADITYKDLFESLFNSNKFKLMDKKLTYVFEMCTIYNRVIVKYDIPSLYLLSVFNNENGKELSNEQVNGISKLIKIPRPHQFFFKNYQKINIFFDKLHDSLFEGFVITHENNKYKIKNPFYVIVHNLKFRGYPYATPRNMYKYRFVINNIIKILNEMNINTEEIEYMMNLYKNLSPNEIKSNSIFILDNRYHNLPYCNFTKINFDNTSLAKSATKNSNDSYSVPCVCEHNMKLVRLKRDFVVPSYCHCGKRIGIYKVACGKLLYICENCNNSHEVHQVSMKYPDESVLHYKGEPLGITCSTNTKIFRLHLHSLLDVYVNKNISKKILYAVIGKIFNISRENSHIAKLDIRQCAIAIILFRNKIIEFLSLSTLNSL